MPLAFLRWRSNQVERKRAPSYILSHFQTDASPFEDATAMSRPDFIATKSALALAERLARRLAASRRGALVLVAEYQPALFEVVRRHLDGDAVARQCLDAVLLHFAGRVGDDHMPGVELHAIACVGQDLRHQTFEFNQFF